MWDHEKTSSFEESTKIEEEIGSQERLHKKSTYWFTQIWFFIFNLGKFSTAIIISLNAANTSNTAATIALAICVLAGCGQPSQTYNRLVSLNVTQFAEKKAFNKTMIETLRINDLPDVYYLGLSGKYTLDCFLAHDEEF
jgi:hypothetical protein